MNISEIYIYPVKSLGGISVSSSKVLDKGLEFDRRWMLVDKDGQFLSQREIPQMTLIQAELNETALRLNRNGSFIEIDKYDQGKPTEVEVWSDRVKVYELNPVINEWLSDHLNHECRLVKMSEGRVSRTKMEKEVSFADGYPFLIIGEESLKFLNSKISKPIEMKNFRPNLVFSGGMPHDEDDWSNIKIGEIKFSVVKPCARCVITTIDSEGKKNMEPLATLNTYRNFNNKIMFGQNALSHGIGKIKIGDPIILE